MTQDSFDKEIQVVAELVRTAALATERIRAQGMEAESKADGSPVTHADIVSQAIILEGIARYFPADRVAAEEEVKVGRSGHLREAACQVLKEMGFLNAEARLDAWVNYRGNPNGTRIWMVDPIDGTKGFRLGLCYAVAVGLCVRGKPQFGCVAAPAFPDKEGQGRRTLIAYAGIGSGGYQMQPGNARPRRLRVSRVDRISELRVVGSRAHDREDICSQFAEKAGIRSVIRMDSLAKYLMLATGRADVYLRSPDPDYGIGYAWDHCAGHVILEEAGGLVTDFRGTPLTYNQSPGSRLKNTEGLVASNARCHDEILRLIKDM